MLSSYLPFDLLVRMVSTNKVITITVHITTGKINSWIEVIQYKD